MIAEVTAGVVDDERDGQLDQRQAGVVGDRRELLDGFELALVLGQRHVEAGHETLTGRGDGRAAGAPVARQPAAADHRDEPMGGFAGRPGESVGSYADAPQSSRAGAGSYAGDADTQRVGGFGDIDRETVTSYHNGVPHIHIATHRDLKRMLVDAGLGEAEADTDVAALHRGRILVLVRASEVTPEDAAQALDAPAPVSPR
jgi:hypothetical protein